MGRVVAPCKLGIKPRARVNSFSWARVKGTAEVNSINSTVLYSQPALGPGAVPRPTQVVAELEGAQAVTTGSRITPQKDSSEFWQQTTYFAGITAGSALVLIASTRRLVWCMKDEG